MVPDNEPELAVELQKEHAKVGLTTGSDTGDKLAVDGFAVVAEAQGRLIQALKEFEDLLVVSRIEYKASSSSRSKVLVRSGLDGRRGDDRWLQAHTEHVICDRALERIADGSA